MLHIYIYIYICIYIVHVCHMRLKFSLYTCEKSKKQIKYPLEDTKQVVEKVCFFGHRWSEGNKFKG